MRGTELLSVNVVVWIHQVEELVEGEVQNSCYFSKMVAANQDAAPHLGLVT